MRSFSILKIFVILVFSSTYCNFVATKTRLKNGITCTTFQLIDEQDFLGIFFTDSCDILKDNHWCAFLMRFTETISGHIGRSYWKIFPDLQRIVYATKKMAPNEMVVMSTLLLTTHFCTATSTKEFKNATSAMNVSVHFGQDLPAKRYLPSPSCARQSDTFCTHIDDYPQ